jgi:polyribonucleotide nucleotidyltransferase
VRDELQEGQQLLVKVINVDPSGKIRLSRKAVLREERGEPDEEPGDDRGNREARGDREDRPPREDRGPREERRGGRANGGGGRDRRPGRGPRR